MTRLSGQNQTELFSFLLSFLQELGLKEDVALGM